MLLKLYLKGKVTNDPTIQSWWHSGATLGYHKKRWQFLQGGVHLGNKISVHTV